MYIKNKILFKPKKYVKTDGLENIYNFTLNNFVDLNLCFQMKLTSECIYCMHPD